MKKIYLLAFATLTATGWSSFGQNTEKCASHEVHLKAIKNNPKALEVEKNFEKVMQGVLQAKTDGQLPKGVVYTIPVVIHIIHNGQAIGTGTNISDEVAISMIEVLNNQFRKLTADSLVFGDPFYELSVDTEIEFCLAQQDEDGNPTTGITRHLGSQATWTTEEFDSLVKPNTIWDRTSYMNLWSCDFTNPSLDGYGTFPAESSDSTDGIVVSFNDFLAPSNGEKSIVATHEVGHYLNLLHIWGDDECGDDLVSDTPPAFESNSGCPIYPHNANSVCGSGPEGEMYMNYMDYSDAECTMVFTPDQTTRMRATLMTLRSGLLNSVGCEESSAGLNTNISTTSFSLYPNPSKGIFAIQLNQQTYGNFSIRVYNQVGQTIQTITNVSSFPLEINLENTTNGIYFIELNNGNFTSVEKVSLLK